MLDTLEISPPSVDLQPRKAPRARQAQLGQFLTPDTVATFMARMFDPMPQGSLALLDAGAGAGALTRAFANRWLSEAPPGGSLKVAAYELDTEIHTELQHLLRELAAEPHVSAELIPGDFIERAATMARLGNGDRYSHAILNPPYKKIGTQSAERLALRDAGIETVNLYSGFVALAVALLADRGEIVAIIPRSFCNGPYYEPFRHFILGRAALRRIHLFDSRNSAFKSDGVLQENVIIHLQRGVDQGRVIISTSTDELFTDLQQRSYDFAEIVSPKDPAKFIHIPTGEEQPLLLSPGFNCTLEGLGIKVSTGPVVDFRMKDDLRPMPASDTVPLLYPGHFAGDAFIWPRPDFKKPNAIRMTAATRKWLFPGGHYCVVRRFSSKEERRRIVANVVDPGALPKGMIGFENHLNVFHEGRQPISAQLAWGLTAYLNSTAVDCYFRQFNGHTQVNATDLRMMRYPSRIKLEALGAWAQAQPRLSQELIDKRVEALA
jgi:hypothetical protein